MTWGNIKKGDAVLEVYGGGHHARQVRSTATAVGPKRITTSRGSKYDAGNGHGEYGWHLHTEATLHEATRREDALATINRIGYRNAQLHVLESFAQALKAAKVTP